MELDAGRRETQVALAGYGLAIAICLACGYRMAIPYDYYQLLGADHLKDRLLESLLYLHAQPPLLNLALGLTLKLSRWLGMAPEGILLAGHIALGAAAVWGFARLSQKLVASQRIRRVCLGIFVFHPAFYMALFHYFYTFHELVWLCLIPLAVLASIESGRVRAYALLCGETVVLVYTHNLFHWSFGAALLAASAWAALRASGHTARSPVRGHLLCFGAAMALLLVWPAKNWALLGEFSYSTWGGYSLALELPIPRERVPVREWEVPEAFRHIPVLSERRKIDGSKNWNHHSMIGHAHKLGSLALDTLAEDPVALLRKAGLNYWNYTRFSGRHPYTGNFGTGTPAPPPRAARSTGSTRSTQAALTNGWMGLYELVFFLDLRSAASLAHRAHRTPPTQSWALSGFVFAFPLLVGWAVISLGRGWRRIDPPERAALLFLLASLLWVLVATLLVDGSEANRIRFPTEPGLLLLVGWLLSSRLGRGSAGSENSGD